MNLLFKSLLHSISSYELQACSNTEYRMEPSLSGQQLLNVVEDTLALPKFNSCSGDFKREVRWGSNLFLHI